ncbi:MAG: hypothetical protein AWU54_396 [Candidatus Frackibacter sp. T328-2]|nr:MAG: hypothetical protein AWU54_396 [Candidatus Frackibacter sp. T328-2]
MRLKRTPLSIIPYTKVKKALKDEPELFKFWQKKIGTPPKNVVPLNRQANKLSSKAIRNIIKIIKEFEEEEKERNEKNNK